jgi:hypothetical protein
MMSQTGYARANHLRKQLSQISFQLIKHNVTRGFVQMKCLGPRASNRVSPHTLHGFTQQGVSERVSYEHHSTKYVTNILVRSLKSVSLSRLSKLFVELAFLFLPDTEYPIRRQL